MADRKETVILEFDVDAEGSVETINQLTAANKALRQERNALNIATDAGKKRAQEINAVIDANTSKIKANVSAIEQQKINIGNYASALDRVVPGMGQFSQNLASATQESGGFVGGLKAMTSGIMGAVRASLAFLATPLGAAIAAISAAFALLSKYLFGTQEGMDKLTAITRPLGAIMERLVGVVQVLGGRAFKALGQAIQNPIQALKDLGNIIKDNIIKRFEALSLFGPALKKIFAGDIAGGFKDLGNAAIQATTGIEDGIDKIQDAASNLVDFVDEAWEQGRRLDELQKLIERGEINQIVRSKQLQLLIAQQKKLVEDVTKSYAERIRAAELAQAAQQELLNTELDLIDKRIEKMELEQSLNDTSREQEKELAELKAQRLEIEASITERSIEFQNKLNELRAKELEQQNQLTESERVRAIIQKRLEEDRLNANRLVISEEERTAKSLFNVRRNLANLTKKLDEDEIARKKKNAELAKILEQQKLDAAMAVTDGVLGLLDEQSEAYRAVASFQVLVSTYSAAQKAYEAAFLPIPTVASPALGITFAAAAVLRGLANLAAINGVEFAEGGWTGPGDKYKPAGIVHADEYVVPKSVNNSPAAQPHIAALESMRVGRLPGYFDGGFVARSLSQPIAQQTVNVMDIVRNMPAPEVSVVEFSRKEKRVRVKESISKI